jgi:steroid 5-alpha reductase family enzyme
MLALALAASFGVQAIFFALAARYRTDKVTDLSYGVTFIAITLLALRIREDAPAAQWILAGMVIVWAVRLSVYLFVRIVRMKRDIRFDGVREHFWRFLRFWFFQGLVVWILMLPVTLWLIDPDAGEWAAFKTLGLMIWGVGLTIETCADLQKFRQKTDPDGRGRWIESGLWRYSRHPNYLGELLCWWGIFLYVAPDLGGESALAAIGPITLTLLLLFVTGIPILEREADRKWGEEAAYEAYKRRTPVLIPRLIARGDSRHGEGGR